MSHEVTCQLVPRSVKPGASFASTGEQYMLFIMPFLYVLESGLGKDGAHIFAFMLRLRGCCSSAGRRRPFVAVPVSFLMICCVYSGMLHDADVVCLLLLH